MNETAYIHDFSLVRSLALRVSIGYGLKNAIVIVVVLTLTRDGAGKLFLE